MSIDFRTQGRKITTNEWNVRQSNNFGGLFFLASLGVYYQRYFRVNKSVPKLALFALLSYQAAGEWSKFIFLPTL